MSIESPTARAAAFGAEAASRINNIWRGTREIERERDKRIRAWLNQEFPTRESHGQPVAIVGNTEGARARRQLARANREAYERVTSLCRNAAREAFDGTLAQRRRLNPKYERPGPQPYGVSHQGAEAFVAQWMRHLGEIDASPTQYVADGGIDVAGSRYIAQVKNFKGTVGVGDMRQMAGVASLDTKRKALFFTSGKYSSGSLTLANQTGIALFIYDAVAGTLTGANSLGMRYMRSGL